MLRNIADEESRFFNCLHALPETTVSLIADLVEADLLPADLLPADPLPADPLPANPSTELPRRLLVAHQLTDIQRVEQMFNLPSLAAQKPSELLEEMLRLCTRGQEINAFFNCLFLNKLPRELCLREKDGGQAGVGPQGRPLRRPQQQTGPRRGGISGRRFFSRARRRGDHGSCNPPRSRQRATRQRRRTVGQQLSGQEEAGTQWRRWTAGVPHAEPRGAGQDREWAVLQPLLLWSQG
jgi:hypothetical protein